MVCVDDGLVSAQEKGPPAVEVIERSVEYAEFPARHKKCVLPVDSFVAEGLGLMSSGTRRDWLLPCAKIGNNQLYARVFEWWAGTGVGKVGDGGASGARCENMSFAIGGPASHKKLIVQVQTVCGVSSGS